MHKKIQGAVEAKLSTPKKQSGRLSTDRTPAHTRPPSGYDGKEKKDLTNVLDYDYLIVMMISKTSLLNNYPITTR